MAPTPNAIYNRNNGSIAFNTGYSVASGKSLFVVHNTAIAAISTPTGWTVARTGTYHKIFTRTATGTSADNFPNNVWGAGLVFDSGVIEDYTSGTWDSNTSVAPAPNGGSALSASTDLLLVIGTNITSTGYVDPDQHDTDATPATTSGFTGATSAQSHSSDGPYTFYSIDVWAWFDNATQTEYKALTTTTPGSTTWGAYYVGTDETGGAIGFETGYTVPVNNFWSATLAFKAASSGTAYTASASGTATATGTASLTKSLTGSATGTETATGTGAITYTANTTASSSITANGTAAGTKTVSINASSTITATGTAGASSTQLFAASATVTATGTSTASNSKTLAASASATATASASMLSIIGVAAAGTASATATASASMLSVISVDAAGTATASATAAALITTRGAMSPLARTFQSMVFRARTTATMKGK